MDGVAEGKAGGFQAAAVGRAVAEAGVGAGAAAVDGAECGRARWMGRRCCSGWPMRQGGRLFEASKKDSFEGIYEQIAEELRGQYVLGFTPDKEAAAEGYHQIELTPAKGSPKDWYVRTRDGYYGKD